MKECGDNPFEWSRECRLLYLLDHWQDIFDPAVTSTWSTFTGISGGKQASRAPSPLPLMASHPTVKKIERALTVLADREPVLACHLKAYRCNVEWRNVDTLREIKLVSGKRDIVPDRMRQKIVPRWVSLEKVRDAELLLLRLVHGDVSIPKDLWHGLTKP